MPSKLQWVLLLLTPFIALGAFANANIDSRQCEMQMQRLVDTSVNCELRVRPSFLADVNALSGGLVTDMECRIPLRFYKADVYGAWVKPSAIRLPKFPVNCQLTSATQGQLPPLTSFIQPACSLVPGKGWQCNINMTQTVGLGILGTVFETQVNNNATLKEMMKRVVTGQKI